MADEPLRHLGLQIRHRRTELGFTQAELAEKTGITRTSITNIEAGRQNTPFNTLTDIAEALGLSLAQLLLVEVKTLPPARFDVTAFYARLEVARAELGLSWRQVGVQAQVSSSTLSRIGVQGLAPNLDGLVRLLVWLGDTDIERYITTVDAAPNAGTGETGQAAANA